jgi:hemerythrin-like domain-containing protein
VIQIGAPPKRAGIDDPLQHLTDCHRRIEQRLDTLERAAAALDSNPTPALDAIKNSLAFFDTAGRLHTIDEEESVFPLLRPRLTFEETAFLDELEADHGAAEAIYQNLKQTYVQICGGITPDLVERFRELTSGLTRVYRAHIATEDSALMPIMQRIIRTDERSVLTQQMRSRRG